MNFLHKIAVFFVCAYVDCTITPNSPKSSKGNAIKYNIKKGPQSYNVFGKNLVTENPSALDVLNNNEAYSKDSKNNFKRMVLGYVTPWNNHGYNVAKIFANKFTHISPVWLQVKPKKNVDGYEITGTHDIDIKWMQEVKSAGAKRGTKIVPRVLFDNWNANEFIALLTNRKAVEMLNKVFVKSAKKWKFDGFVLEVWSQLGGRVKDNLLNNLIKEIGQELTMQNNLDMILVVPPKHDGDDALFTPQDLRDLHPYVSAFSLMTYDYSNVHKPGPNAPISWVKECVTYLSPDEEEDEFREKILTGLNFYGNKYSPSGGGPIVAHEYLEMLKKLKGKIRYDSKSVENFFEVKESDGKHLVFYPTLHSIFKRIDLADEMQTGLSIWELGQGLDYFYDLL